MNNSENSYKYTPIRLLGRGSYGKAYLVECREEKTLAVIKMIQIGELMESEKKEAYMEAKILEKLDHPNIIKFKEVFLTRSPKMTLNLVMDYADGGDLMSKIMNRSRFFNESQILDWFTQICLAIKHIHDRRILHRDLKSQNIFLTKNGLIKLGDFGVAKCLNYTLEQVQTITGTPYYLSPEIVLNKPYSFKSDIWSLGVLLYEICALKVPFNAQSLPKLSLFILKGRYSPIPTHFSKDLKNLVNSMLDIDPNKRPSISEIMKMSLIKNRTKVFLNEFEYCNEFSHTILHKFNFMIEENNTKKSHDKLSDKIYVNKFNNNSPVKLPSKNKSNNDVQHINLNPINKLSSHDKKSEINDIKYVLAKHKKNVTNVQDSIKIIKNTQSSLDILKFNNIKNKTNQSNNEDEVNLNELKEFTFSLNSKLTNFNSNTNDIAVSNNEMKELVSTHKMLIELSNIEYNKNIIHNNINEVIEIEKLELDEIILEKACNSKNFENVFLKNELNLLKDSEIFINETINEENIELDILKEELEKELGRELIQYVSNIILENSTHNIFKFEFDVIQNKILLGLELKYSKNEIVKVLDNIYEIWSIVLKERQKYYENNNKK